jgi:hypothetical protein
MNEEEIEDIAKNCWNYIEDCHCGHGKASLLDCVVCIASYVQKQKTAELVKYFDKQLCLISDIIVSESKSHIPRTEALKKIGNIVADYINYHQDEFFKDIKKW